MSMMPIQPLRPLPPVRPNGWTAQPPGRAVLEGQTLVLSISPDTGLPLLSTQEGLPLPILPAAGHQLGLMPGDVVTVKVLATQPALELAVLDQRGGPDAQAGAFEWSPATRAADQAALLRIAWAAPDPAMIANAWRVLVLTRMNGQEAASAQPTLPERWHFSTYAWWGLPVHLQLLPPEDAPTQRDSRQRRAMARLIGRPWGMRIDCVLPWLGPVEVQLHLQPEGAVLLIYVPDEQAAARLNQARAADRMIGALAQAGLRMLGCRITSEDDHRDGVAASRMNTRVHHAEADLLRQLPSLCLPGSVFQAAAEVLLVLTTLTQSGSHARPVSPAFR
ncbi:MAG: flagellar hook-length control protein FliK [Aquabacterium sp.]